MKVSHSDRLLSVKYYLAGLAFISMVFLSQLPSVKKKKKPETSFYELLKVLVLIYLMN